MTEPRRILYERFTHREGSAFWYIDSGHINGYQALGCDAAEWFGGRDSDEPIASVLDRVQPDVFVGCLQRTSRGPAPWLDDAGIDAIRQHRGERGMKVAVRSGPSNMRKLFEGSAFEFEKFQDSGVASFYLQPDRPTPEEQRAIDAGLIDLVRSPFHASCLDRAFASFLDAGLSILEEPHAADATRYRKVDAGEPVRDVLFVGNCWTFKWANMGPYIERLQDHFGDRFAIFGEGWPDHVRTLGPLVPRGESDALNREVARSRVSIALHEPTQVLSWPFSGNERVFKLLACGAAVVSDANPILPSYFAAGDELRIAADPVAMISGTEALLTDGPARGAMGEAGRRRVLEDHTYKHRARRLLEVLDAAPAAAQVFDRRAGTRAAAA
ncbi:MAG: glycosyltransferase [Phycisphaerales bacterium]